MKRAWLFPEHAPETLFSGYGSITQDDTVIAIDAGLNFLHGQDIRPHLIIGDLDSIDRALLETYSTVPTYIFPQAKNETDTELAVDYCLNSGIDEIIICNDLGGRFDHALALVQNMLKAHHAGVACRIESTNQRLFFLERDTLLPRMGGHTLSLISWSPSSVFGSCSGLAYPLDGLCLKDTLSRGISNIITDHECHVELLEGTVLAILTK